MAVQMKYAEGKVLQDDDRTLSFSACYGKWLFLIMSVSMMWSIALYTLKYPLMQQEKERAGKGGFPRLLPLGSAVPLTFTTWA